jgi:photosystem II stability/assembly factor-like uncharacterized protein
VRAKGWSRKAGVVLLVIAFVSLARAEGGWVAVPHGVFTKDLNAVFFADSKRGWVAGDGGYVSRTVDGGLTWTQQPVETREAINDIYFRNKEDGYLLAGNSIFVTDDGGQHWRELRRYFASDFGGATAELYSVRFSGKKRGWVVGSVSRKDVVVDSLVIYTNDGGKSWQRQRVPTREELIHLDFADEKRGWIVGVGGTVLFTQDSGETWTPLGSGTTATLYHVDFRDERVGWAVGERATVLRTTDGGQSWLPVDVPVRGTLLSVQFVDADNGWIVGRGGVILRSSDAGRTWVRQESRTKQNLYALFLEKKWGWAVGSGGIILQYAR